jgi:hypothetical protein
MSVSFNLLFTPGITGEAQHHWRGYTWRPRDYEARPLPLAPPDVKFTSQPSTCAYNISRHFRSMEIIIYPLSFHSSPRRSSTIVIFNNVFKWYFHTVRCWHVVYELLGHARLTLTFTADNLISQIAHHGFFYGSHSIYICRYCSAVRRS